MDNTKAFSIVGFCVAHNLSRATYYNLQKAGKGPVEMRVGSKVLISVEAAEAWRRRREADAPAEAAAAAQRRAERKAKAEAEAARKAEAEQARAA